MSRLSCVSAHPMPNGINIYSPLPIFIILIDYVQTEIFIEDFDPH